MGTDRAANEGATRRWAAICDELTSRPADELSADELDLLADALFWLDRVDDSVDNRRLAYRRHVADQNDQRAALAAWRLFYDHFLVGESAIANGWLERCRVHVGDDSTAAEAGWLRLALADVAARSNEKQQALAHAIDATRIARSANDSNLLAMALQAEGRAKISCGDQDAGMGLFDEAMIAVTNGELDAHFTGWVYCNVVSTCYQLADLDRASQWSRAASRWCDTLDEGRMYPGLCRVYSVELSCLQGAWDQAESAARQACQELTAFDPRYAGEAFYLVGELRRLRGDLVAAEEAYTRAHELGRVPQPGLALALAASGCVDDAIAMLRTALPTATTFAFPRAQLVAELVTLEIRSGQLSRARSHVEELNDLARSGGAVVSAIAEGAIGRLLDAEGRHGEGYDHLSRAASRLNDLAIPYESARLRLAASGAVAASGDTRTARLDAKAALGVFERLEANPDLGTARALLAEHDQQVRDDPSAPDLAPDTPLTAREVEVLQLVASGSTNRQIATELHLSSHTVGRHLSNIFNKIDVNSRAAATAYAYQHGLVVPH